jgi:hypothetical protein
MLSLGPPKCKFSNNSVSHKVASLEQNNILHQSSTLYNKPKAIYSNHIAFSSCLPIFFDKDDGNPQYHFVY